MKNLIIAMLTTTYLFGGLGNLTEQQVLSQSNVGNNESYEYEITEIQGNEIYGIPINKASRDNKGIFLYKNEVSFNVDEGDRISVIWGSEEDIFQSITKIN